MKIYYSHSENIYGTEREKNELNIINEWFRDRCDIGGKRVNSLDILNPNVISGSFAKFIGILS